jgi:probable HAF family extracellular repeat protein
VLDRGRYGKHVLDVALLSLSSCGGSSPPSPAATVTISASAAQVAPGAAITLTWKGSRAENCMAEGEWSGALAPTGTRTLVPPIAHNEFGIECTGPGGPVAATTQVSVALPHYTVTKVNLFGVYALNDFDGIAGWTGSPPTPLGPPPFDAAAWTSGSAPPLAPPPPGEDPLSNCPPDPYTGGSLCESHANGINSAGEVVVSVGSGPLGQTVIHYGPGYATVVPGLLSAEGIDDAARIVGQTFTGHPGVFASGSTVDLGTFGGNIGIAHASNAAGRVVGSAMLAGDEVTHAFLSDGAGRVDLGELGGGFSDAWAVNDSGVAVGESKTSKGDTHAVEYVDNHLIDIGATSGPYSFATGINNAGLIVGSFVPADSTDGNSHPFIYGNRTMFDLWEVAARPESYPPGVSVSMGLGIVRINNHGEILVPLCDGDSGGPRHTFDCWAVLLTPAE